MVNFSSYQGSCPFIKNILLLDSQPKVKTCSCQVLLISYDWPTLNAKLAFQKSIFTGVKLKRQMLQQKVTHLSPNH
ncbi:hypothetical protein AQUCO_01800150v1 [Aquilegia coerulea]|uniref:Uncharacterized protein n=1 Tax=Aquilegia coerulea TaxID=218851 RepID=A0A2G5DK58_AQUCA|nr:hypothetical protein AQUCO_01800150v1 [Aquilegia coerulea]